jgi:hypothetical protein
MWITLVTNYSMSTMIFSSRRGASFKPMSRGRVERRIDRRIPRNITTKGNLERGARFLPKIAKVTKEREKGMKAEG